MSSELKRLPSVLRHVSGNPDMGHYGVWSAENELHGSCLNSSEERELSGYGTEDDTIPLPPSPEPEPKSGGQDFENADYKPQDAVRSWDPNRDFMTASDLEFLRNFDIEKQTSVKQELKEVVLGSSSQQLNESVSVSTKNQDSQQ
jgi:hypothetical protein